jgi:hypothetical protein
MESIERFDTLGRQPQGVGLYTPTRLDEMGHARQYVGRMVFANGMRIPFHFQFQGVRAYESHLPGLAQPEDSENRLRFDRDSQVVLGVERTLEAAHVQIDLHAHTPRSISRFI